MMARTTVLACALAIGAAMPAGAPAGERLYNGIALPDEWPPRSEALTLEPMTVPYLENPPQVIPIDVGRQLFVDDFLIEETALSRVYHRAEFHEASPLIEADRPWEIKDGPRAAVAYSGGAWFDPEDDLFKIWYAAASIGRPTITCYARSPDGIHWEKPDLDVEPGTNVVLRHNLDSTTVWLNLDEKAPGRRYRMFVTERRSGWQFVFRVSPDGVHWSGPVGPITSVHDRSTAFHNPFRNVWVYSIRDRLHDERIRKYREHADVTAPWRADEIVPWVRADRLDPRHPSGEFSHVRPQLYNLDAVAYESIVLGLFSIWQGPSNKEVARRGIVKRNEVLLGFSRDGFHWHRPDRRPFLGVNETAGAWNWGNVQSVGGGCLVVGDKLYFYASGRSPGDATRPGRASTGLAVLRRDGFASLRAGSTMGRVTTRPVQFTGRHLFVNVDCDRGKLLVEVLDENGRTIAPFTRDRCTPVSVDKVLQAVTWKGAEDLSAAAGRPVRLRFYLQNGSLYAFWVSPDRSGASYGYVAGGGPGFTGSRDTAGSGSAEGAGRRTP